MTTAENVDNIIINNLKKLRNEKGIMVQDLSKKLYRHYDYIGTIERRKRKRLTCYEVFKIAEVLGCRVSDLFFE